ncbi:hypothetical protein [Cellulomonas xiejunii]|uniref:NERD domain-containing protein n=1 Tax=Cellulomonas xiejunii TaxID=2968083 RepID=A0ABY5KP53_9CELL|nr:hypothetical protein [Cellulomonas xiejunii]MCC2323491.1 hypothetical protein [Cellulomonas xiejunii]UUI71580.1 hypothetical protein NP048_17595 [Cellulomonas xiejunii]
MSTGNEPTATRHGSSVARTGARRGLPSWARQRALTDALAADAVAAVLRDLAPDGWTMPDDVHGLVPARDGPDHVVVGPAGIVGVGPGGVVVVAVRSQAGAQEASDTTRRAVAAHAADAAEAAAEVATLLAPRHRTAVRALVCLTDHAPSAADGVGAVDVVGAVGAVDVVQGVAVVGIGDLAAHLRALPPRLHPADVAGLAQHLTVLPGGPRPPDVLTTAALETDARVARRRVVRPVVSGRPAEAPGHHRAEHPRTDRPRSDLSGRRLGPAGLALRAGGVATVAWLAWVLTTAPLGLV